ncbi:hypothetical protein H4218_004425, partial [Coemansia sp. IMI 209128]
SGSDNEEELLNAAGPSHNGISFRLLHQLVLAGLARHMWPVVDSLRTDLRDSSSVTQTEATAEQGPEAVEALNEFLSDIMPLLCEIEFYGPNSKAIYGPRSKITCGELERL